MCAYALNKRNMSHNHGMNRINTSLLVEYLNQGMNDHVWDNEKNPTKTERPPF